MFFLFLIFSSCDKDNYLPDEDTTSYNEFLNLQNSFNPEYINKSLNLGKDNFQVNWNNYQIINFNKSANTTTYEFDVFLKREAKLQSNLFSGEIIYKLIVTEENKQNYTFNILRFEPYKTSLNKNPKINNVENYDGLKYTITYSGKIEDIQNYEKGIVTASFKKDKLETNNSDLHKEAAIGGICDATSFYFTAKDCADAGGSSGGNGWVVETVFNWRDWFKSTDGGESFLYTHTENLPTTYRWVYIFEGHDISVNSYTSDGDHANVNYPPYSGNRIFNKLSGKADCLHKLIDKYGNSFIQDILKEFNGESEFDIRIVSKDKVFFKGKEVNATTTSPVNGEISIKISTYKANSNKALGLVRTIIHEYIHADMFRKLNTKYVTNGDVLSFKKTYNAYENGTFQASAGHETMAALYVDEMAKALKDFHKNALVGDYTYLTNNGINPLPDSFYEALAWQGLKNHNVQAWFDKGKDTTAILNSLNQYYHSTTNNCPKN